MADKMKEVSHTNPYTDESFGENFVYRRGQTVVADGGERGAEDEDDETDPDTVPEGAETDAEDGREMKDVDHTPPNDSDGANRVYERGTEGREEKV